MSLSYLLDWVSSILMDFLTQILGESEHEYAFKGSDLIRKKSVLISSCNFFKGLFMENSFY